VAGGIPRRAFRFPGQLRRRPPAHARLTLPKKSDAFRHRRTRRARCAGRSAEPPWRRTARGPRRGTFERNIAST
jgi:hypothetical protein